MEWDGVRHSGTEGGQDRRQYGMGMGWGQSVEREWGIDKGNGIVVEMEVVLL